MKGEREMRMRSVFLPLVTLAFVFTSRPAFASDPGAHPGKYLIGAGYELTVEGLREVFTRGKPIDRSALFRYVAKEENRAKFAALVPDIKNYLQTLPDRSSYEGQRMRCIAALFAVEKNMSKEDIEKHVKRIRETLFVKKKIGVLSACRALVAAHEHRGVDIRDDLIHLSKTDILDHSPEKLCLKIPIGELFRLYHTTLTEAEILDIMTQWPEHQHLQNYALESAKRRGFLLEMEPIPEKTE